MKSSRSKGLSCETGSEGAIDRQEDSMMELALTEEIFQCGDSKGNGCGRVFDGLIVRNIGGLCAVCAEDLPDEVGC